MYWHNRIGINPCWCIHKSLEAVSSKIIIFLDVVSISFVLYRHKNNYIFLLTLFFVFQKSVQKVFCPKSVRNELKSV